MKVPQVLFFLPSWRHPEAVEAVLPVMQRHDRVGIRLRKRATFDAEPLTVTKFVDCALDLEIGHEFTGASDVMTIETSCFLPRHGILFRKL